MSRPGSSTGMAAAWIGGAFLNPNLSIAFNNSAERPSSENNLGVIVLLQPQLLSSLGGLYPFIQVIKRNCIICHRPGSARAAFLTSPQGCVPKPRVGTQCLPWEYHCPF